LYEPLILPELARASSLPPIVQSKFERIHEDRDGPALTYSTVSKTASRLGSSWR